MRIWIMNAAALSAEQVDEMRQMLPMSWITSAKHPESVVSAWLALGALYCGSTEGGLAVVKDNHLPFTRDSFIHTGLQWDWVVGEHGKPFPDGVVCNGVRLYISLSHSGGFAAVAVDTVAIGLDIQAHTDRSAEQILLIARRFHPNERNILEQNAEQLSPMFHRLWAAKESVMKLDGRGLSMGLGSFCVECGSTLLPDGRTADVTELEYKGIVIAAARWK